MRAKTAALLIDFQGGFTAFIGTNLAELLRRMDVNDLLFAGVSTNVCVESTLRDAFQLGFRCRLVRDWSKYHFDGKYHGRQPHPPEWRLRQGAFGQ
jgi:isochorismate hydrolase